MCGSIKTCVDMMCLIIGNRLTLFQSVLCDSCSFFSSWVWVRLLVYINENILWAVSLKKKRKKEKSNSIFPSFAHFNLSVTAHSWGGGGKGLIVRICDDISCHWVSLWDRTIAAPLHLPCARGPILLLQSVVTGLLMSVTFLNAPLGCTAVCTVKLPNTPIQTALNHWMMNEPKRPQIDIWIQRESGLM